ncbi:MAG: undecaprenyl-diphosphate phosphatase [Candidatus Nanoarchaeia archaeon]|nr:undecaprenyl-diphosphate phosphatase [Candidatus Nanoarchaeia archaeon]
MVSWLQLIVLSIIQGVAEWFPVSSSGHLAIFQKIFGFENLSFDVFLHLASIIAVIILFRKEIARIFYLKDRKNLRDLLLIILGIIPAGILGFLFKKQIAGFFSSLMYIGIFFILSGILVYSTRFSKEKKETLNWLDSLFIGIFQAIAIVPGISRSGATISSGMFRGLKKEAAVKFSFLLAIPIVLGAALLEIRDLSFLGIDYPMLIISFIITFVTSLMTIKYLLKIVKSDKFYLFGIYNFILGVLVLLWGFVR